MGAAGRRCALVRAVVGGPRRFGYFGDGCGGGGVMTMDVCPSLVGLQGGRCAAIRMKVLPSFGWCRRQRRLWVSFPFLEVSPR